MCFNSVYVDLKYTESHLTLLLGLCACMVCVVMCRPWYVCEVVLEPYVVGEVFAMTVMRVLLFVSDVSMMRESEGARVTAMLVWETVEVWLRRVQGMSMWVEHMVQILC